MGALRSRALTLLVRWACVAASCSGLAAHAQANDAWVVQPFFGPDEVQVLDDRLRAGETGPCPSDRPTVEVEGVGTASFDEIAFDGVADVASLVGTVCIDLPSADARLRASEVRIAGIVRAAASGDLPDVDARAALLDVGPWSLAVERITGTPSTLRLTGVLMRSPDVVVAAPTAVVAEGAVTAFDVALTTHTYAVEAASMRIDADGVEAAHVSIRPCNCDVGRYLFEAESADASLAGGTVILRQATWHVASVALPLGGDVTVGPDGFDGALPLDVTSRDPFGTVVLGRWTSEGVTVEAGASLGTPRASIVSVSATNGVGTVEAAFDPRGVVLEATRAFPGFTFVADVDLVDDDPVVRWGARAEGWSTHADLTRRPAPRAREWTTLQARASATVRGDAVAEPASAVGDVGLAGFVAAAVADGAIDGSRTFAGGTITAGVQASASIDGWLAGGRASSSVGVDVGAATQVDLGWSRDTFRARASASGAWSTRTSPFAVGEEGDDLRVAVRIEDRGPWGNAALDVVRVWAVDAEPIHEAAFAYGTPAVRLGNATVSAGVDVEASEAWNVGGPYDVTSSAVWVHAGGARVALEASLDLPAAVGDRVPALPPSTHPTPRSVSLVASVPVRVASRGDAVGGGAVDDPAARRSTQWGVVLTPTLGLDLLSLVQRGEVRFPAHGLTVEVEDCCATWTVGYVADGDETSVTFGVALPPFLDGSTSPGPVPLPPRYRPGP